MARDFPKGDFNQILVGPNDDPGVSMTVAAWVTETKIGGCRVLLPSTVTIVMSDGREILATYHWKLRPITRHWYKAWIKRIPRG